LSGGEPLAGDGEALSELAGDAGELKRVLMRGPWRLRVVDRPESREVVLFNVEQDPQEGLEGEVRLPAERG
jgi:hypothetical protein